MPSFFPSILSTQSFLMNSAMSSIGTSFTDTSSDLDLDAESTAHARNPTKNAHIATEPFETVKGHNGPVPYALLSIDASSHLVSVPLHYSRGTSAKVNVVHTRGSARGLPTMPAYAI